MTDNGRSVCDINNVNKMKPRFNLKVAGDGDRVQQMGYLYLKVKINVKHHKINST